MEFVYEDLGYTKEQVLYSVVHMDEETPHIHCTVVPLVKKYDKRTNSEKWTISKKEYIKDRVHVSILQDKYHARLINKGYKLERGIKGSNDINLKTKEFKKVTRYYEKKVNTVNENLENAMNELDKNMKKTKNIPFDKKHIIIENETFDSMNKVIKESKNALELQTKINDLFKQITNFTQSHQTLEKKNKSLEKEVKNLDDRNKKLQKENNKLRNGLKAILFVIKSFFRNLLQIGNEPTKQATASEIKQYYDSKNFKETDVYDIAVDTTKEEELFDYVGITKVQAKENDYEEIYEYDYSKDKQKDDFEISL